MSALKHQRSLHGSLHTVSSPAFVCMEVLRRHEVHMPYAHTQYAVWLVLVLGIDGLCFMSWGWG